MNKFSSQYGRALYSLAKDENIEEVIAEELDAIEEIIKENKDYVKLLDTPALSVEERIKLCDEAFSSFNIILLNFIKILVEKKSVRELLSCKKEYFKEYDKDKNIERAVAITKIPLSEEQILEIKKKAENITGKTVYIKNEISDDVIGGVILRFSDSQYDGSVKGRLKEMENLLKSLTFQKG